MSFTFSPEEMSEDIKIVAATCAKFLEAGSTRRLEDLANDLRLAVLAAKTNGTVDFVWKTHTANPIKISTSTNWKGSNRSFSPMHAIITIDYKCQFDVGSGRVQVKEGVSVVRLRFADFSEDLPEKEKVFHFDAASGGWANANGQAQAGHPAFHMQFYGLVNDIPRLPSLIFHPVDVISLAVLELHQSDLRNHLITSEIRSKLRHFPRRQVCRIIKILDCIKSGVTSDFGSALISLQNKMNIPLNL